MIVVACKCGKRLRAKDEYAGKRAKCPACGHKLIVPKPKMRQQTHKSDSNGTRIKLPRVNREINPEAEIYKKRYYFENDDAKHKAYKTLRGMLPPVDSCYKPSGRRSPETIAALIKGLMLGAPVSACVGLIMLLITASVLKLFGHLDIGGNYIQIYCGIICLLIIFPIVGVIAALVMSRFSKSGMNRDPSIAGWMAAAAVIIGVLLLGMSGRLIIGHWSTPTEDLFAVARAGAVRAVLGPFDAYWQGVIPLVSFMSGIAIAILIATQMVVSAVGKHKFCEKCEIPMSGQYKSYLVPLSVYGAKQLVAVLNKRPRDPVELFKIFDRYDGRDCDAQLFVCPSCGIGILEAEIHFSSGRVKMQGGRPIEEKDDVSWMVASEWLSAKEVKMLGPFRANVFLLLPLPIKVESAGFGYNIKLPE